MNPSSIITSPITASPVIRPPLTAGVGLAVAFEHVPADALENN